ncbi:MAG: hypothetical protein ACOYON_13145 [Fimbriimonas sp.]
MNKRTLASMALSIGFVASSLAGNIALGAAVTLTGEFGVGYSYSHGAFAPKETLTDGNFLAEHNYWSVNTVWWDTPPGAASAGQKVTIDLGSVRNIVGFTMQADDNDYYSMEFDDSTIAYMPRSSGGGMRTRSITLLSPVNSRYLTIMAHLTSESGTDGAFSLSEVQVFDDVVPGISGPPVGAPPPWIAPPPPLTPEPAPFVVFAVAGLGYVLSRRH